MRRRVGLRAALAAVAAVIVFTPASAFATVTLTTPAVRCSLTANLAVLSKTKQLTGSASVSCIASSATNVTVTVQVVELDGTVIDRMGNVFFVSSGRALTASTKAVAWTVTTPAKACVSADGTGLEDYYVIASISNGSARVEEMIGRIDGWNC